MTSWDRLSTSDEEAVRDTMMRLYSASTGHDLMFFDNHFRHLELRFPLPAIDESVFIGTDPDEFAVGHAEIVDLWANVFLVYGSLPMKAGPEMIISGMRILQADSSGSPGHYPVAVAWVSDRPTVTVAGTDLHCRFTASLVYLPIGPFQGVGRWLFTQAHLSIGIQDEKPSRQ